MSIDNNQLAMINDFMSNSQEFYTDQEAMNFLMDEVHIGHNVAKQVLTYRHAFATNPFFSLQSVDL